MTNEERFIVSCEGVGETGVRDKLNAGRYGERKTMWASSWLEKVESGKSDATRAEERSRLVRLSPTANRYFNNTTSAIFIALLLTGATVVMMLR